MYCKLDTWLFNVFYTVFRQYIVLLNDLFKTNIHKWWLLICVQPIAEHIKIAYCVFIKYVFKLNYQKINKFNWRSIYFVTMHLCTYTGKCSKPDYNDTIWNQIYTFLITKNAFWNTNSDFKITKFFNSLKIEII